MREDQYKKIGSPNLTRREILFRGIGAENYRTIGQFNAEIEVDGEYFAAGLSVVPNDLLRHDLLLGTDFLNKVNLYVEEGKITMQNPRGSSSVE